MSGLYILVLVTIPLGFADPNPLDEINIHFNIDDIENKGQAPEYGDTSAEDSSGNIDGIYGSGDNNPVEAADYGNISVVDSSRNDDGHSGSGNNDPLEGVAINRGASVGEINHYEAENEDSKDSQNAGSLNGQGEPGVYNPMYEPELGSIHGQGHIFGHTGNGHYKQYYDNSVEDLNGNIDGDSGSGDNDPLEGIVINSGANIEKINNYEAKKGHRKNSQNAGSTNGQGTYGAYNKMNEKKPSSIHQQGGIVGHIGNGHYTPYHAVDYGDTSEGDLSGNSGSGDSDQLEGITINSGARVGKVINHEANRRKGHSGIQYLTNTREGHNGIHGIYSQMHEPEPRGALEQDGHGLYNAPEPRGAIEQYVPEVYNEPEPRGVLGEGGRGFYNAPEPPGLRRQDVPGVYNEPEPRGILRQGAYRFYNPIYKPKLGGIFGQGGILGYIGNGRNKPKYVSDYDDTEARDLNGNVKGDKGSGNSDGLEAINMHVGTIGEAHQYSMGKGGDMDMNTPPWNPSPQKYNQIHAPQRGPHMDKQQLTTIPEHSDPTHNDRISGARRPRGRNAMYGFNTFGINGQGAGPIYRTQMYRPRRII